MVAVITAYWFVFLDTLFNEADTESANVVECEQEVNKDRSVQSGSKAPPRYTDQFKQAVVKAAQESTRKLGVCDYYNILLL